MKLKNNSTALVTIVFSSIILIILFLSLPQGFILGGDWTFPFSIESYKTWTNLSTWNSKQNFGDSSVLSLNAFYYNFIVEIFFLAGIPLKYIQITIIIVIFILGQLGFVFFFINYLNTKKFIYVLLINIVSLSYIFSPPNFNFLIMGWILGSISYLLYPFFLFFLFKSLNKKQNLNCFFAALIFSISIMQIHTIAWYLLMSLIFLFDTKVDNKRLIINYLKICLFTIFLNIHWIFPLLLDVNQGEHVFPSTLYKTAATKGMDLFLNFNQIFKLHGSLFNEHYESWLKTSYTDLSNYLAFIPMLILLILLKENKVKFYKLVFCYILILAISLIVINLNKQDFFYNFSYLIPFRHLSRFIIIFPFLINFLIICMIFSQFVNGKKFKNFLIFLLLIINIFNLEPWINNLKYNKDEKINWEKNFKLREFKPSNDYIKFYRKLNNDKDKFTRSLYFPYGALIFLNDDKYFSAGFLSIVDIFSNFSPIPGAISVGSGRFTNSKFFIEKNFVKNAHIKFKKELINKLYTVDLFIYRKNISSNVKLPIKDFKNFFENKDKFKLYYESENIVAYERIKKNSLIESMKLQVLNPKNKNLFYKINKYKYSDYIQLKNEVNFTRKNDSIIYIEKFDDTTKSLVFNESYSENWCLLHVHNYLNYPSAFQNLLIIKSYFFQGCSKKHSPVFSYSNIWNIDKKDNIILIFSPQIGFIISKYIYLIFLLYLIFLFLKKNFFRKYF
jgi:hypothetical protein